MPCALIGGGNHQVLAAKKYAIIAVSIQTTGASSIDSHLLYAIPVPSTASEGGTKLTHSIKYVQLRLPVLAFFCVSLFALCVKYPCSRPQNHLHQVRLVPVQPVEPRRALL